MADATNNPTIPLTLECVQCGAPFNAIYKGRGRYPRFCSGACKRERHKAQCASYRKPVRHRRSCMRCGEAFTASKPTALYCSNACKASLKRRRKKERGWKRPPQPIYWAKKRALKRQAHVDDVDPFVVFERDGWRCHMCGKATTKSLRGTYKDRAPELDHIVPLSLGGEHSYRNTACSCRKCNQTKNNSLVGQLRLFG